MGLLSNALKTFFFIAAMTGMASCYSSVSGEDDVAEDRAEDRTGEDGIEIPTDVTPDSPTDAPDTPPDTPPDLPPDLPPFLGVDFLINHSGSDPGPIYFAVWGWDIETMEYPFEMTEFAGGEWVSTSMYMPWCTVDCEDVEEEWECCIDCGPPWIETLQVLEVGDSVTEHWDGTTYTMNWDVCECGCHDLGRIEAGRVSVKICAYSAMICHNPDGGCVPDENGIIQGAGVDGASQCIDKEFEVTDVSGGTVLFEF